MKYKIGRRGVSIMELVVATGIFAILAAMILYNYPEFTRFMSLKKEISQIVSNIRLSQVYTLGTKQHKDYISSEIRGYGVNFNKDNPTDYYIFADRETGGTHDLYDSTNDELSKTLNISGNKISDLKCDANSVNSVNILYKRPYVDVVLKEDGGGAECLTVDIIIESSLSSNIKKMITIQKSGGVISIN